MKLNKKMLSIYKWMFTPGGWTEWMNWMSWNIILSISIIFQLEWTETLQNVYSYGYCVLNFIIWDKCYLEKQPLGISCWLINFRWLNALIWRMCGYSYRWTLNWGTACLRAGGRGDLFLRAVPIASGSTGISSFLQPELDAKVIESYAR